MSTPSSRRAKPALGDADCGTQGLYDSAPIGLAFFSRDYRYLRINDELAAINGVPVEDHIGRTIRDVLSDQAPAVEPSSTSIRHRRSDARPRDQRRDPAEPGRGRGTG